MPRRSAEATVSFLLSSRAVGCWACWPDAGSTNAKESKAIVAAVRVKKYHKESFMACSWNRSVARRKLRMRRALFLAPFFAGRLATCPGVSIARIVVLRRSTKGTTTLQDAGGRTAKTPNRGLQRQQPFLCHSHA